jgi:5-methylcytosine-specific restriction endonuclease McrA
MRRDKNDEQWQEVKRKVFEIDKGQCLLCQDLTASEMELWKQSGTDGFSTTKTDPAHHHPVSLYAELMYDVDNLYTLCRCHHERLDYMMHPLTGKHIQQDEVERWWQRIINRRKINQSEHNVELPEMYYDSLDD